MPDFDPYHRWLGIPPDEQPAGPHRLLGISPNENDPQVVREAALRQTAFVRKLSMGKHGEHAERILGELADARDSILSGKVESPTKLAVKSTTCPVESPLVIPKAATDRKTPQPLFFPSEQPTAPAFNLRTPAQQTHRNLATTRRRAAAKPIGKRPAVIGISMAGIVLTVGVLFVGERSEINTVPATSTQIVPKSKTPNEQEQPRDSATEEIPEQIAAPQPTRVYTGHSSDVMSLAFSPDGKTLASGGMYLRHWVIESGKEIPPLDGEEGLIWSIAFSPDGETIATGQASRVKLWSSQTGELLNSLRGPTHYITFSPNSKLLAATTGSRIVVWDRLTGKELKELVIKRKAQVIPHVAFGDDGKTIAAWTQGKVIARWNLTNWEEVNKLGDKRHPPNQWGSYSPDGALFAAARLDGRIQLYDAQTKAELKTFQAHDRLIRCIAFSPEGKLIASGGGDNTIKLWDVSALIEP